MYVSEKEQATPGKRHLQSSGEGLTDTFLPDLPLILTQTPLFMGS